MIESAPPPGQFEAGLPSLTERRLEIYINDVHVGTLSEDNDLWAMTYDPAWVASESSFDLSPGLPRKRLEHRDGSTMRPVQWYFDNLLPEEKLRELIAKDADIRDKDDAFALLQYLGAESAGSLTLLSPGKLPEAQASLQSLTPEELSGRIAKIPKTTLTKDSPKRMSLAGAQHKMLVVLKGTDLYEPVGATPSTHILKPDHPATETYPASTFMEWLTMKLADAAGLDVPAVHLLYVPEPVYAIERFDRQIDANGLRPETGLQPPTVQRVHVIDACQLLNKSRLFKHTGASIQSLRETIEACGDVLTLPTRLYRWLVFNLLVANDDCHLKNLSFIVTPTRVDLSPHYDMLATSVYRTRAFADAQADWPNLPLAIPLGPKVALFSQVTQQALLTAGKALGVPPTVGMRISRQVVLRTIGAFDDVFAQHYPEEPRLGDQLARNNDRDTQPNQPDMQDPAPDLVGDTRTQVAPLDNTDHPTEQELAQQRKILRVLRYIVLPEMAQRIL